MATFALGIGATALPVLVLAAVLACLWPVHRATRADVLDVLRVE